MKDKKEILDEELIKFKELLLKKGIEIITLKVEAQFPDSTAFDVKNKEIPEVLEGDYLQVSNLDDLLNVLSERKKNVVDNHNFTKQGFSKVKPKEDNPKPSDAESFVYDQLLPKLEYENKEDILDFIDSLKDVVENENFEI